MRSLRSRVAKVVQLNRVERAVVAGIRAAVVAPRVEPGDRVGAWSVPARLARGVNSARVAACARGDSRPGRKVKAFFGLLLAVLVVGGVLFVVTRQVVGLLAEPVVWVALAASVGVACAVGQGESLGGIGDRVRTRWSAHRTLRLEAAELSRLRRLRETMPEREWRRLVIAVVEGDHRRR